MEKYVVIGDPVEHSRSPGMQNAAFRHYGLNAVYDRMQVKAEKFSDFVEYARENLTGFNLTVPHKSLILPYLDRVTPAAAAAGSVNTVTVSDGRFYGDSTDGYGLEMALKRNFELSPEGKCFVFLGCGGAACATAFHLAERGARAIYLANRTVEKAESLAAALKAFAPALETGVTSLQDNGTLKTWFEAADAVIQATSLGLHRNDPPPVDLQLLQPGMNCCFFDTIYHETPLQKKAAELQLHCAGGMWMLIYQGARSFEVWTGKKAPINEMLKGFMEDPSCVLN